LVRAGGTRLITIHKKVKVKKKQGYARKKSRSATQKREEARRDLDRQASV